MICFLKITKKKKQPFYVLGVFSIKSLFVGIFHVQFFFISFHNFYKFYYFLVINYAIKHEFPSIIDIFVHVFVL